MIRFLMGFVVGSAVGATAVVLVTPWSGAELVASVQKSVTTAISAGQEAARTHEEQMWVEFRERMERNNGTEQAAKVTNVQRPVMMGGYQYT